MHMRPGVSLLVIEQHVNWSSGHVLTFLIAWSTRGGPRGPPLAAAAFQLWENTTFGLLEAVWTQVCLDGQVRRKLVGKTEPCYSQYTCYTGIADFTPPDIDTVGYRVFLGNGKYFVSSDVGGGKMQWCAPPAHAAPWAGRSQVAVQEHV